MSFSSSTGAKGIPLGTVIGESVSASLSLVQPYTVGSRSGGLWSNTLFHIATCRWACATFSLNPSVVGGNFSNPEFVSGLSEDLQEVWL